MHAWGSHRIDTGNVQAKPAADAGTAGTAATEQVLAGDFFVAVGDGTQKLAWARAAMACREAMMSELDGALPAVGRHVPAEAQAPPKEVAKEVAHQEKSLATFLQRAFGKAADRASHQLPKSLPKLVEKSVEFGLKKMTHMALQQMIPDMDPHVVKALSKDVAKIALSFAFSGVVNVGLAMKSHVASLPERAAPSASPET